MTGLCIILIDAVMAVVARQETQKKGAFGRIQADVCRRI